MTPKEFAIALQELIKSRYLERVAEALRPPGEPKDIVQDVLFSLVELIPEDYSDIQDLKRYAAQAVRHRCFELARRKRREPPMAKLDEEGGDHLIQSPEASSSLRDPYQIYEQEQLHELVHASIDTLSPLERVVVRLAHLEGESRPAIASRLQLSKHVVRGNSERARKKMKTFLTDLLDIDPGERSDIAGERPRATRRGCGPEVLWMAMLRTEFAPVRSPFYGWLDRAPDRPPMWARLKSG